MHLSLLHLLGVCCGCSRLAILGWVDHHTALEGDLVLLRSSSHKSLHKGCELAPFLAGAEGVEPALGVVFAQQPMELSGMILEKDYLLRLVAEVVGDLRGELLNLLVDSYGGLSELVPFGEFLVDLLELLLRVHSPLPLHCDLILKLPNSLPGHLEELLLELVEDPDGAYFGALGLSLDLYDKR